ncbi:hypothetical protein BDV95DRAFT_601564 [Massariosphaeria phaeospora]|uniref:Telomere replication protein EST3 n=1 Tax=Massariosphaeria phaeospora TaxID=100035 RepID=A0A7C8IHA1_9PLEO|nr:hypothetical protein BDV95DRAFT_601564 [Massariosphaeria phaeospora]
MSNRLTPWLEETFACQLLLGNRWLKAKTSNSQAGIKPDPDREWAGLYEDSGSCLDIIDEIHPTQNANIVILQQEPLLVTDGESYVSAQISSGCARDFYTRYDGKSSSQVTTNTIVAVRKYAIRHTSYGPPQHKLRLVLVAIDWQGEGDTAPLGQPNPLQSSKEIQLGLQLLHDTRIQADHSAWGLALDHTTDTMPRPTGMNGHNAVAETMPDSQMAFGTQAPHTFSTGPAGNKNTPLAMPNNVRGPNLDPRSALVDLLKTKTNTKQQDSPTGLAKELMRGLETPSISYSDQVHQSGKSPSGMARSPTSLTSQQLGRSPPRKKQRSPPMMDAVHEDDNFVGVDVPEELPYHAGNAASPHAPNLDIAVLSVEVYSSPEQGDIYTADSDWMQGFEFTHTSADPGSQQRSILMKEKSWYKHHEFPEGNIPIQVLTQLRTSAETAKNLAEAEEGEEDSSDTDMDSSTDSSSNEESEGPIATGGLNEDVVASISEGVASSPPAIAWSITPPSQPRKAESLPPDSSIDETRRRLFSNGVLEQEKVATQTAESPVVEIGSSPPSPLIPSLPVPLASGIDYDDDTELDSSIPQGLGEDIQQPPSILEKFEPVPKPEPLRHKSVIQVKETPYFKGKNGYSVPLANTSSATQPNTSSGSGSIVEGTYNGDHLYTMDAQTSKVEAERRLKSQKAPHERLTSPVRSVSTPEKVALQPKQVRFPSHDVTMKDAGPTSVPVHNSFLPRQNDRLGHTDTANPEREIENSNLTPVSFQIGLVDSSSSNEQVVSQTADLSTAQTLNDPTTSGGAELPSVPPTKRKLEIFSPKQSARPKKRREIKIVSFRGGSPLSQDPVARVRIEKKEWIQKTREECEQSGVGAGEEVLNAIGSRTAECKVASKTNLSEAKRDADPADVPARSKSDSTRQETVLLATDHPPHVSKERHASPSHQNGIDTTVSKEGLALPDAQSTGNPIAVVVPSTSNNHVPFQPPVTIPVQESTPLTVYDKFTKAYPEYTGGTQHFIGQCQKVYELELEDKMVPKWQWDDFIIRNRTDYIDYVTKCLNNGKDPEPYIRFYKDKIRDTKYREGIIESVQTLVAALEQLDALPSQSHPSPERVQSNPRKSLPSRQVRPVDNSTRKQLSPEQDRPRRSLPASWNKAVPSSSTGSKLAQGALKQSIGPSASTSKAPTTLQSTTKRHSTDTSRQIPNAAPTRVSRAKSTPVSKSIPTHTSNHNSTSILSNRTLLPDNKKPPASNHKPTPAPTTKPPPPSNPRPTPTPRTSTASLAPVPDADADADNDSDTTENSGDKYREFLLRHQRLTSWTGSKRASPHPSSRHSASRDRG